MVKNIVICDDSDIDAKTTKSIVEAFVKEPHRDGVSIEIYSVAGSLIEDLKHEVIKPDLIFMDIELKDMIGMDAVKQINQIHPRCFIVYLTNYIQYATDVYSTEHHFYVLKSELKKRLAQIHEKIRRVEDFSQEKVRFSLLNSGQAVIPKGDIVFIERKGRVSVIRTIKSEFETKLKLAELENLLGDSYFVRCHNSYIVGLKHIKIYKRDQILMENEVKIPISRSYQQKVREVFVQWSSMNLF
ncbi:MAG: LytR/AlgR family response regulator transcription factor [Anaerostipes sp.]|jgi:DNA-binding LytR/AlgR family response regulator